MAHIPVSSAATSNSTNMQHVHCSIHLTPLQCNTVHHTWLRWPAMIAPGKPTTCSRHQRQHVLPSHQPWPGMPCAKAYRLSHENMITTHDANEHGCLVQHSANNNDFSDVYDGTTDTVHCTQPPSCNTVWTYIQTVSPLLTPNYPGRSELVSSAASYCACTHGTKCTTQY